MPRKRSQVSRLHVDWSFHLAALIWIVTIVGAVDVHLYLGIQSIRWIGKMFDRNGSRCRRFNYHDVRTPKAVGHGAHRIPAFTTFSDDLVRPHAEPRCVREDS